SRLTTSNFSQSPPVGPGGLFAQKELPLTLTGLRGLINPSPAEKDSHIMATVGRPKRGVPEGLWIQCPQCKATIFRKEAESRFNVCPECDYHFPIPARERIRQLLDQDSFEEWFSDLRPKDPLGFVDRIPYAERLKAEQARTGMAD